jgi:hypothetical protein
VEAQIVTFISVSKVKYIIIAPLITKQEVENVDAFIGADGVGVCGSCD